jgi:hypothetical protein
MTLTFAKLQDSFQLKKPGILGNIPVHTNHNPTQHTSDHRKSQVRTLAVVIPTLITNSTNLLFIKNRRHAQRFNVFRVNT